MSQIRSIVENAISDINRLMSIDSIYQEYILNPLEKACKNILPYEPDFQVELAIAIKDLTQFTLPKTCGRSPKIIIGSIKDCPVNGTFVKDDMCIYINVDKIYDLTKYIEYDSNNWPKIKLTIWKNLLYDTQIKSIFAHEFQHLADQLAGYKQEDLSKYKKLNLPTQEYAKKYYNNHGELNAHIIQKMFDLTYEMTKEFSKDESGKFNKRKASEFITNYLKNNGWKNDEKFTKFYNMLDDKYKRRVINRLYSVFTEWFEE